MDDNDSEFLRPWSADAMLMTLEYVDTGDPATDDLWRKRRRELLLWMSRRPDVAARTLMSLLFSIQAVKTFDSKQSDRPVVSLLHAMAARTLSDSMNATQPKAPMEEVSLAASFMEDYTSSLCPDLQKVLRSLHFGDDRKAYTTTSHSSGEEETKTTLLAATPDDVLGDSRRLFLEATARLEQRVSAIPSAPPPPRADVAQKRVLLLRRPPSEDSGSAIVPAELVSLTDSLPPCIASDDHSLLQQIPALRDAGERAQLDAFVAATPLPLAVRSLEEMASLAQKKEVVQQSTTVIRTRDEEKIVEPRWARKGEAESSSSSSSRATSIAPGSNTEAPAPGEEKEEDKTREITDPLPANENVNVIENKKGVTVLLTHKGIVFKTRRQKGEKRDRPQGPATNAETPVATTMEPTAPTAKAAEERTASEPKATCTDAEGKEENEVQLKSRDELQRLVHEWEMSTVLQEAVMIGLEPPPSVVQLPEDYIDE